MNAKDKLNETLMAVAHACGLEVSRDYLAMYGVIHDFDMVLYYLEGTTTPIWLFANIGAVNTANVPASELKKLKSAHKSVENVTYKDGHLTVLFKNPKKREAIDAFPEQIKAVLADLKNLGFVPGCGVCGKAGATKEYMVGVNSYQMICDECASTMARYSSEKAHLTGERKEHVFKGILGALLGALIYFAVTMITTRLGFVLTLPGGLLLGGATVAFYKKFAGKFTKKSLVICAVIMVFAVAFTYLSAAATTIAMGMLKEGGLGEYGLNFFDCLKIIPDVIAEGVRRGYLSSDDIINDAPQLFIMLFATGMGAHAMSKSALEQAQHENRFEPLRKNTDNF